MTNDQKNAIDDLCLIRGGVPAKAAKFILGCVYAMSSEPNVQLGQKAVQTLFAMHQKYAKQIKKAKKNAYVLLPSGEN